MHMRRDRLLVAMIAAGAFLPLVCVEAEEPPSKEFSEHARETAAAYKGFAGANKERELKFVDKAILRWTNPLGGRKAHGEVFLWIDRGRPAAALSLYEFVEDKTGTLRQHHEFCSLTDQPLDFAGAVDWSPAEPGVELVPFAEDVLPADSARQRLKQMRDLAGQFTAEKTTREGATRDLRLLPQPVYRYEPTDDKVSDGGLFALVEHTDPEMFLILESRGTDMGTRWHFAFTRMTSVGLKAHLNGKLVWEGPVLPWRDALSRKDKPYTAFQVR